MKLGIKSLQDFLAFLIRRKWWVIAPFVALSCIVALLTRALPRIYVSEALVLVKPRDVPENFVIDLVAGSAESRLRTIQTRVLSRSNLVAILDEFNDELPELKDLNKDEQVQRLVKQIHINFNIDSDPRGYREVTAFKISYQHKDPKTARAIAQKLTDVVMKEDLDSRQSNVSVTTGFLATELAKMDKDLQESDTALRLLKSKYQNALPGQLEANQRALDRLSDMQRSNDDLLERNAVSRLRYEEMRSTTPEFLPELPRPAAARLKEEEEEEKDPLLVQYLKLEPEYKKLKAQLPPNSQYPDLLQLEQQLARLKAQIPPDVLEAALKPKTKAKPGEKGEGKPEDKPEDKPVPNPTYLALNAALRELNTEYDIQKRTRAGIKESIAQYSKRVEITPQVDLEMTEVQRVNAQLRTQRDGLNTDLTKATMSQSLENNAGGDQFNVVDPANLPIEPSKPNKWIVLLVGCAISLALAIGIGLAVDVARQRVWTQSEIEGFWGVPVMVDIPEIVTDSDYTELKKRRLTIAASLCAGLFLYSVCLYGIHLKTNYILQSLDPVLQQVVYR